MSSSGLEKGFVKEGELPSTRALFFNDRVDDKLTQSGLLFKALQIALWKKPKFMIAENVAPLIGNRFKEDFHSILCNIQDIGYNIYYTKYNSRWFNIPQNRSRAFLIMIRDDLNIHFQLPQPIFTSQQLKKGEVAPIRAEEWFEKEVADEYYLTEPDEAKKAFEENVSFHPNFQRDYISCLTTNCGTASPFIRQTLVEDSKGIRCLTSEELMRFQGFPPEYGTILREHGYTKEDVGKLVGNSMTVPVIKAILKSLLQSIIDYKPITGGVVPTMLIEAQIDETYISPLVAYSGNKSKLLPYLRYRFPSQFALQNMTFVDLFAGSAFMAINTPAERVVINEINPFLVGIYKGLCATPPEDAWKLVMEIVEQYGLSTDNKENFYKCRTDYNKISYEERVNKFWYWGLALVYHSYNASEIRHNKGMEYTGSFGGSHCNLKNSKEKFFPFATALYESKNIEILCQSFKDFKIDNAPLDERFFFYVDPLYLTGDATYNESWTKRDEQELYDYLDELTSKGAMWMLSNALENNGIRNQILADWLNSRNYYIYYMKRTYTINRDREHPTLELMVTNYKLDPLQ